MAEYSKIDYLLAQTDAEVLHVGKDGTRYNGGTWSPFIGCDKGDRAGCAHCWAEAWARRNPRFRGHWGPSAPRYFFGETHWQQPLRWQRKCERLGVRKRVLVSLCDPFEGRLGEVGLPRARHRLWKMMRQTPSLDWLLLTKRPENLTTMLCSDHLVGRRPLSNLWLGVSCWDQASADRNIPLLLEVPAAVRWVSFEPLLGPVDVSRWLTTSEPCHFRPFTAEALAAHGEAGPRMLVRRGIDWIVVGCESRGARPGRRCDLAWVEGLGRDCEAAGVPVFAKQLPEYGTGGGRLIKSAELAECGWPVQLPMAREGDRLRPA